MTALMISSKTVCLKPVISPSLIIRFFGFNAPEERGVSAYIRFVKEALKTQYMMKIQRKISRKDPNMEAQGQGVDCHK